MRQKLGLCCSLIHDPDLLILDEPTTGVDPLSRRQFWELIERMRARRAGMSVMVATAYMEEAERFDWLVAMNDGQVLAAGSPADLKARTNTGERRRRVHRAAAGSKCERATSELKIPPRGAVDGEPVIVARDLTCRFGDFTAVDRVSFTIERGEIFGFVGSNGCGKTTTMKMLTGLLGAERRRGAAVRRAARRARHRFAPSRRLHVAVVLALHRTDGAAEPRSARAAVPSAAAKGRRRGIDELVERFRPGRPSRPAARPSLPLGIRQRLSLAVAIVHEPEMLILDEPTSGVDPLARDRFWELLIDLSRNQGVTIFVSTHFMNEAERCDRISLMDSGRVLATDTPANLVKARGAASLEDAFIGYLEEATGSARAKTTTIMTLAPPEAARMPPPQRAFSPQRVLAYTIRETIELLRDPIRLGFAFFGIAFLMLVFGFGISNDVNNLTFAVLDRDNSHESRAYLEELRGSSYFLEKRPLINYDDLQKRLQSGDIDAAVEIPPGFGRDIERQRPAWVGAWVDGAMPFRAETIRGYLQAMHQLYLADPVVTTTNQSAPKQPARIEIRYNYNQDFRQHLRHGAVDDGNFAGAVSRDSHGARDRARKGNGLDHQPLRYTGYQARIPHRQADPLRRRRRDEFPGDLCDGAVCISGTAERQFHYAPPRCRDLRHYDDSLRYADFVICQHADRGDFRHRHA